jgi:hypothetical protein
MSRWTYSDCSNRPATATVSASPRFPTCIVYLRMDNAGESRAVTTLKKLSENSAPFHRREDEVSAI